MVPAASCEDVEKILRGDEVCALEIFGQEWRSWVTDHISHCLFCAEKFKDVHKAEWVSARDPSLVETSTIVIESHNDSPEASQKKQPKINQALQHFIRFAAEFPLLEILEPDLTARQARISEAIDGLGSFFDYHLLDLVPKVSSGQGQLKVQVLVRMEFMDDDSIPPFILMDWMAGTQNNMNLFPVEHADFRGLTKAVKPYVQGDAEMHKTALLALLHQLHIFSKLPADLFGSPLRLAFFARSTNITIFIVHLVFM